MKVFFPEIKFPAFKLKAGQLLNVSLMGVGLIIPPWDLTFWDTTTLLPKFPLFDTDELFRPIMEAIEGVAQKVIELLWTPILNQLDEYYGVEGVGEEEE